MVQQENCFSKLQYFCYSMRGHCYSFLSLITQGEIKESKLQYFGHIMKGPCYKIPSQVKLKAKDLWTGGATFELGILRRWFGKSPVKSSALQCLKWQWSIGLSTFEGRLPLKKNRKYVFSFSCIPCRISTRRQFFSVRIIHVWNR